MIISPRQIEQLAKLECDEGILSLYLRLDPRSRADRTRPLTQCKSLLTEAGRRPQNEHWQEALQREGDREQRLASEGGIGAILRY